MKNRIDANSERRQNMNWDEAGNNWEQFRKQVEQRWQDLSSEQVSAIAGRREKLLHELQRTYRLSEHQAEVEVKRFEAGEIGSAMGGSGRGETERAREFGSGNQTEERDGNNIRH